MQVPQKWMVYKENPTKMDDGWGYPHDLGNPQMTSTSKILSDSFTYKHLLLTIGPSFSGPIGALSKAAAAQR